MSTEFIKQLRDSLQPETLDMKPNFKTTLCDGIALMLNFSAKMGKQPYGDQVFNLLHLVVTCDEPYSSFNSTSEQLKTKYNFADVMAMVQLQKELLAPAKAAAVGSEREQKCMTVFLNYKMDDQQKFQQQLQEIYLTAAKLGDQSSMVNTDLKSIPQDLTDAYDSFIG